MQTYDIDTLAILCVYKIANEFEKFPILDELMQKDRDFLLEILDTDLPLEMVIPLLNDDMVSYKAF